MAPAPDDGGRKRGGTVGVYDRPASADRPSWVSRAVAGVAVAAAAVAGWWYLWPGG